MCKDTQLKEALSYVTELTCNFCYRDDMDFHKRNDLRNRATEKTEDKKTIVRGKETKLKANIWREKNVTFTSLDYYVI